MAVKINGFIEGTQPDELMKLLLSLASNWGDVYDTNKLKVVHLSGAMTNVVYRITWPKYTNGTENDERTVLVRIYGEGSDIFFDREEEIRTFESISTHGHGPRLLGQFPQGRVEEFIHAKTLSACDLRDPEISALIAAKMREFHKLDMPGTKNAVLWPRMRKWVTKARSLCSPEQAKEFQLEILENEIDKLEKELSKSHQDIVFCHNDLQYGNVMIDDTRTITLIDYEYASYNPVAYDLANHFCEWAADYHTDTPHVLDYNRYPDLEERRRFVQSYLSSAGNQPRDDEVDLLIEDVEKYTLANHLFWGLWGLISGYVTRIDFDYIEYARQRFGQYWLRKPQLLKGKMGISQEDSKIEQANGVAT
ncbi:probable choline kinase 1 [Rutidosis leptorrhynchoides]|uniref:probable choline kinase 1 n=1 Tax=Rutidosis leptorrhynchoides TaxID=125765 RepID=UPI003A98FC45